MSLLKIHNTNYDKTWHYSLNFRKMQVVLILKSVFLWNDC